MNMQPILQQLTLEDFNKMRGMCTPQEKFFLQIARLDPSFEYRIDLPGPEGFQEPEPMLAYLADKKMFPDD